MSDYTEKKYFVSLLNLIIAIYFLQADYNDAHHYNVPQRNTRGKQFKRERKTCKDCTDCF